MHGFVAHNLEVYELLWILHPTLALLGLLLFALHAWPARRRPALARASRIGLGAVALVALASWSGFGQLEREHGFAAGDVYHYYVGSKYAAELGYFDLYDCTVVALREEGLLREADPDTVRNLRTLEQGSVRAALERGRGCPQTFGPERWERFKADLRFFHERAADWWKVSLADAGYHPTPVWSLVGGSVANLVPVEGVPALLWIDRGLVLGVLLGVVWAFGLEIAALFAIAWSTCELWSYQWLGFSFFRLGWFGAAFGGLCLLRRRPGLGAGFLLALSALLRIFPAVLLGGYAAHVGWRLLRSRRLAPEAPRVFAGAALALALLVPASVAYTGGPSSYGEFASKIGRFSGFAGVNMIGLGSAANEVVLWQNGYFERGQWSRAVRVYVRGNPAYQALRYGALALFLGLFALALLRTETGWEAAALGFLAVPMLSMPPNYYYGFSLAAALLALRRPALGVVLLLAVFAWSLALQLIPAQQARFLGGASFVAVAFCFAAILAMLPRPRGRSRGSGVSIRGEAAGSS